MSKLNEDGLYVKYIHTDFVHTDRLLCKRPWQDTPVSKDTNEPPPPAMDTLSTKNYNENMYYKKSTPDTKKLPNGGFFEAA